MARARFHRLPPERREAILDVAAARFAESGFDGASYNRILDEAGLPKSSAYYLFDGKADLYAEVLDREAERLIRALPPPARPADAAAFWAGTREWLRASVGYLAANPQSERLLAGYVDARRSGSVADLDARIGAVLEDAVFELVRSGRAAGAVRADAPEALLVALASAVLGVLDHHLLPALGGGGLAEIEAALDLYVDSLRRLLGPV